MKLANAALRSSITFLVLVLCFIISGCDNIGSMQKFKSDEGRFSIMVPSKPEQQNQTLNTPIGILEMKTFVIDKPNIAYIMAYVDYPDEVIDNSDPEAILDGARDGMLNKADVKLINEEEISYGEDPAREIQYTVKGKLGKGHIVILLSGRRLYQVGAVGLNAIFPQDVVQHYIDSFEIW
ncbi:MAG: hypothetical protein ABIK92_11140 [Pseudomonadota bacterium]